MKKAPIKKTTVKAGDDVLGPSESKWKDDNRSSMSITEQELPEIKDWKIGEKYKLEVTVEMTGISKETYRVGEPISASFKIDSKSVKVDDEKKEAEKAVK